MALLCVIGVSLCIFWFVLGWQWALALLVCLHNVHEDYLGAESDFGNLAGPSMYLVVFVINLSNEYSLMS